MVPKLVIVGRPNVGKSSLLNMLAGRRISIVEPTAGVTRDRVSTLIEVPPADLGAEPGAQPGAEPGYAELVDTGGYGVVDEMDLSAQIERQIARGVAEADVVLFVIDVQTGLTPLDHTVARLLRDQGESKPVIILANKVDAEHLENEAYDALQLGFGEPVMVSATTRHNLDGLYERIRASVALGTLREAEEAHLREHGVCIAIVGKRNAGKSTMINALAGEERVIVSELEGTTRDSVDVRLQVDEHLFTLIDTAGVRKRKSVKNDIEYYATHRALRSVRRADVCLLVIDATVPVSQVDRQLVNEIVKHHRPTVIVVNKWDLAEDKTDEQAFTDYLDDVIKQLRFAPIVFTSAISGAGMREVLGMALNLYEQAGHRVGTAELNAFIETVMNERGPAAKGGRRSRIYYATQIDIHPPTIMLSVNDTTLFDHNYELFLLNRMRDALPYSEVPIKLIFRGKERQKKN